MLIEAAEFFQRVEQLIGIERVVKIRAAPGRPPIDRLRVWSVNSLSLRALITKTGIFSVSDELRNRYKRHWASPSGM